jgi:hypothetical protein
VLARAHDHQPRQGEHLYTCHLISQFYATPLSLSHPTPKLQVALFDNDFTIDQDQLHSSYTYQEYIMAMVGFGAPASIIAVVQITTQIAQVCGGYLSEVRHARENIQRLREKTETLNKIVEQLYLKVKDAGLDIVPNLHSVLQRMETCKSELKILKDKLAPGKPMKLFERRALKWPFSSKET